MAVCLERTVASLRSTAASIAPALLRRSHHAQSRAFSSTVNFISREVEGQTCLLGILRPHGRPGLRVSLSATVQK